MPCTKALAIFSEELISPLKLPFISKMRIFTTFLTDSILPRNNFILNIHYL